MLKILTLSVFAGGSFLCALSFLWMWWAAVLALPFSAFVPLFLLLRGSYSR